MSTKQEIREELANLMEMEGLVLALHAKAFRLNIALGRDDIVHYIEKLWEKVEFERGVQHDAFALGHGEEEE